ncbi:hypothetical protein BURPS305_1834 [Burkholderia pseudomallei 305]|nr:hypothetical protein BURPS305_1834 [Burkholderia pseudomallei 305]
MAVAPWPATAARDRALARGGIGRLGASARPQRAVPRAGRIASDVAPPGASRVGLWPAIGSAPAPPARRHRAASNEWKAALAVRRSRRRGEFDSRRGVE